MSKSRDSEFICYPAKHKVVLCFWLLVFCFLLAGCGNKLFDPAQIGRFRPVPAVNVILDSLGVADEPPSAWEGAEEPKPADVMAYEADYVFGSGDRVRMSIFELFQEGAAFTNEYIVTESGKISIPDVGVIEAAGLTESQLEEEVRQILSPSILKEPSVTVILINSEQRSFSISGNGIPGPSRYIIPRYDFRLLDALATAGGISQFNISYVYVSRSVTGKEAIGEPFELEVAEPAEPRELIDPEREMLEIIAPRAKRQLPENGLVITSAEMITDKELAEAMLPEGFVLGTPHGEPSVDNKGTITNIEDILGISTELSGEKQTGRIEWIFQDGKWVPIQIGSPEPAVKPGLGKSPRPLKEKISKEFDWGEIGAGGVQRRVIKIPADKLSGGDPRYNIVIKPGDNIQVPVDIIGEFCIMGNVNRQGYINLTGRPMTLKMAIAAAGGLGPLAWPKRCEVIRRIDKNKEEIVMVDLERIARGEQPDFFIKPDDLINVGTHYSSRWRAVLRNAFRATYGFGFIYDRNFADRDFGTRRPIPDLF